MEESRVSPSLLARTLTFVSIIPEKPLSSQSLVLRAPIAVLDTRLRCHGHGRKEAYRRQAGRSC
jgi:hypothetical protein